jgi:hypothetical protein
MGALPPGSWEPETMAAKASRIAHLVRSCTALGSERSFASAMNLENWIIRSLIC